MAANDEHVIFLSLERARLIKKKKPSARDIRLAFALDAAIRALSAQQPEPDWEAALDRATDRIVEAQQTEAVACVVGHEDGSGHGRTSAQVDYRSVRGILKDETQPQVTVSDEDRDVCAARFEEWWGKYGQYSRAGGGDYEKTFAYNAWMAVTAALRPDAGEQP